MISAKRARATKERGESAKLEKSQERKPYWKAYSALTRRLLILSTLLRQPVRRSYLRTLLICFVIRKYSATRKLGRLFRIPSMNLLTSWTSRGRWMIQDCSEMTGIPSSTASSRTSLRLVQKTSGLFNTLKASNTTVASEVSKPAVLDIDKMDTTPGFTPEDFGGIIADLPLDLNEEDYLDSFVDLSSFLLQENSKGSILAADSAGDCGKVKEFIPTDFSGIESVLAAEPAVFESVQEVATSTTPSLRKRKRVEYDEMDVDDFDAEVVEICPMADHDYVTKKPKLTAEPVAAAKVLQITSTSQSEEAAAPKGVTKYRERRDKNNEASRRSRLIRKQKYIEMDHEAKELEVKNDALRKKIVELEELAKTMKAVLIKKMTEK